ncbi:hypothetical protein LSAT2_028461 [Lamellibrachia satsuma]|nr:hypothetical protein LSAT2_028461 [Lamellibrachia satsuma]
MATVTNGNVGCDDGLYTGDGQYGDQTPADRAVVAYAWPIIKDLLSCIPFAPGHGPFVICDYGAADGLNSLGLTTNCIDWVQKTYGEDQQVHIIYEDRQTNDFNSLIRYIEGVTPGSHSYLESYKNVFVSCCGRSFYKQCLPDASVHLGFSLLALMWLSERPSETSPEVFNIHLPEGSHEQHLLRAQSTRDWQTFLLHRGEELVPGGRLLIVTLDSATCTCTKTGTDVWCRYRAMTDIWREMMHEDIISEDEFLATTDQSYWHRAEDLSAPFNDKNSRVAKSGLKLVAMELQITKCVWRERWLKSNIQGDSVAARAHAVSSVQSIRTWNNRIYANGLSKERTVEERKKILDELFRRLVDQVAMAPAERGTELVEHFVTVAKEATPRLGRD